MLPLATEQTYEHCKYFKFKSHFFNRRLIESGFKAIGGKYHDLKGFHWKNIRTDRQPLYLERMNILDTDQTNGHYSHSKFLMHAKKIWKSIMNKQEHNISFMEGFKNYVQIQFSTMKRQTDIRWIKSSLRMPSNLLAKTYWMFSFLQKISYFYMFVVLNRSKICWNGS